MVLLTQHDYFDLDKDQAYLNPSLGRCFPEPLQITLILTDL